MKSDQKDSDSDDENNKRNFRKRKRNRSKIVKVLKLLMENLLNWRFRINNLLENFRNDEILLEFGRQIEDSNGESLFEQDLSLLQEDGCSKIVEDCKINCIDVNSKETTQNVESEEKTEKIEENKEINQEINKEIINVDINKEESKIIELENDKDLKNGEEKIKDNQVNIVESTKKKRGRPKRKKEDISSPSIIQEPLNTEIQETDCGICLLDLHDGRAIYSLPNCSHSFHLYCVSRCLNSRNIQKKCLKCHIPIEDEEIKQIQQLMIHENRKTRLEKRKK